MKIGKALKKARKQKNISQKELSKLTGIHSQNISDYETDKHKPSWSSLEKIEKALNTSLFVIIFNSIERDSEFVKNKFAFDINYEELENIIKKIF